MRDSALTACKHDATMLPVTTYGPFGRGNRLLDLHPTTKHASNRLLDLHPTTKHAPNRLLDLHPTTKHAPNHLLDLHPTTEHAPNRLLDSHPTTKLVPNRLEICKTCLKWPQNGISGSGYRESARNFEPNPMAMVPDPQIRFFLGGRGGSEIGP